MSKRTLGLPMKCFGCKICCKFVNDSPKYCTCTSRHLYGLLTSSNHVLKVHFSFLVVRIIVRRVNVNTHVLIVLMFWNLHLPCPCCKCFLLHIQGSHLNVFGKVSVNELGFEKEVFMGCV
jgi:hypothetical protein